MGFWFVLHGKKLNSLKLFTKGCIYSKQKIRLEVVFELHKKEKN